MLPEHREKVVLEGTRDVPGSDWSEEVAVLVVDVGQDSLYDVVVPSEETVRGLRQEVLQGVVMGTQVRGSLFEFLPLFLDVFFATFLLQEKPP